MWNTFLNFIDQAIQIIQNGIFSTVDFIKNVFTFIPNTLSAVMPQDFANWLGILIPFIVVILIIKMVRG